MKQFLLPAAALSLLAGPVVAAPTTQPTPATHVKSKATHMSRSETLCLKNARSKYKAGAMRNRADAKCRQEAHAMNHHMAKPAKRKA